MNYTFRKATAILFSRIVLTQLDNEQRSAFRKAEKLTKQYTKIKSILSFTSEFCMTVEAQFIKVWFTIDTNHQVLSTIWQRT